MTRLNINKKAIAMSFNWIFAIIAGGFILFLAIYGAGKFIRTSEQIIYTETAASLISLFDPLETGLASGKATEISFKKKSKIFFDCDENENRPFGKQEVSFSEQTFGEKYGEKGGVISIKDKYIFSDDVVEGKKLYYFTKPLFIGFKVADLLMIYTDEKKYCVYDADEDFKEDIEGLNLKNIFFMNESVKCEGIRICFDSNKNCDIRVFKNENYIVKDGKKMYYIDELIYGAVFSSPEIYECNVKRIKSRFNELAKIYLDKINILKRVNCEPTLGAKLAEAIREDIKSSRDFNNFYGKIKEIDSINQRAKDGCKLYYNVNWRR